MNKTTTPFFYIPEPLLIINLQFFSTSHTNYNARAHKHFYNVYVMIRYNNSIQNSLKLDMTQHSCNVYL